MKFKLFPFLFILIGLLAVGCRSAESPPTPTIDINQVATIVAATLNAPEPATETAPAAPTPTMTSGIPEPTATATATLTPTGSPQTTGEVIGRICYRTRDIPAMTAYFQETESEKTTELPIQAGQTSYSIDLSPGEYIAFAWLEDFSVGGLYSQAVPCGLRGECTDHAAIKFEVKAGETVEGIDICDFYAFNVPEPPDKPSDEIRGTISGQISYPDGSPPALHIVAFNIGTSYWYYILSLSGAGNFTIPDLPPGTYHLVAYQRDGRAGGYADSSHNLIPVEVKAGETSSGSITDWSAPASSFPNDPTEW